MNISAADRKDLSFLRGYHAALSELLLKLMGKIQRLGVIVDERYLRY